MNQYTKTTIVNSFDKKDFKKLLGIDPEYVCEAYRHDGRWGRKEEIVVDLTKVNFTTTPTTPDVVRLEVRLHTVGAHLGEFQNALTRNSELFTYEAKYGTATEMASALEAAARNHRNTSKNFDFEVKANAGVLTFTAGADYIRFKDVFVNEVASNLTGYEAQVNKVVYTTTKDYDKTVITSVKPGMNGFGDTAWIINNFQLPTYVNTNWMALHQDERPVPGKLYNQFTLHAVADRGELTGMGAVGQKMASKTTHVFYVAADLSGIFEQEILSACNNLPVVTGTSASSVTITIPDPAKPGSTIAVSKVSVVGAATPNNGTTPMTKYEVPVEVDTNSDGIGEPSTDDILK